MGFDRFKGWLREHGIKVKDVAKVLGRTESNTSLKLNGKVAMSWDDIETLCLTYSVSPEIFLRKAFPNGDGKGE